MFRPGKTVTRSVSCERQPRDDFQKLTFDDDRVHQAKQKPFPYASWRYSSGRDCTLELELGGATLDGTNRARVIAESGHN